MKTLLLISLAAIPALAGDPLTDAVMTRYNSVKQNLLETAEVMPEANYGFKLTGPQRTFGAWIEHTALGNYNYCSGIKGEAAPDMKQLHGMTAKADLQKALKDSFDYCDAALSGMDDKKALTEVTMGAKKSYPVTSMVALVSSLNEHYGNLVGYLRSKGIVPPSSARAKK